MIRLTLLMVLLTGLSTNLPTSACAQQPIVVFAGSASQPPLEESAKAFEAKTGTPVTLHTGGSGAMLSQLRLTGLGDLYIPGSPDYLDKARTLGLIDGEPVVVAYLVPALLVAKGNPLKIAGLEDLDRQGLRVGLADPDGVCVGLYAVEILAANAMLDRVKPNLRGMVESCAKAASMIPLNLVDVVLGWREFALWNPRDMEAILLEPAEIPRLAYIPAALLKGADNPQGARTFMDFLRSEQGQAIFRKWGYRTDEEAARVFAPRARIGGRYSLPEGW